MKHKNERSDTLIIHYSPSVMEKTELLMFIYKLLAKKAKKHKKIILLGNLLINDVRCLDAIIEANKFDDRGYKLFSALENVIDQGIFGYCEKEQHNFIALNNIVITNGYAKIVKLLNGQLQMALLTSDIIKISSTSTDILGEKQYLRNSEMLASTIALSTKSNIHFYRENDLPENILNFLNKHSLNFELHSFSPPQTRFRVKRYKALR